MLESSLEVTILQSKQDYEVSIIEAFSSNPKKLYNHLKMLRNSNFVPDHLTENETLSVTPRKRLTSLISSLILCLHVAVSLFLQLTSYQLQQSSSVLSKYPHPMCTEP